MMDFFFWDQGIGDIESIVKKGREYTATEQQEQQHPTSRIYDEAAESRADKLRIGYAHSVCFLRRFKRWSVLDGKCAVYIP